MMANNETFINEVFHETGADVIGVVRMYYADGKTKTEYFPVAQWADAETLYSAARVVMRLAF